METLITSEELAALGIADKDLQERMLRITTGVLSRNICTKQFVLEQIALFIHDPKAAASDKRNKLKNLALLVRDHAESKLGLQPNEVTLALVRSALSKIPKYEANWATAQDANHFELLAAALPYATFGAQHIDEGAIAQMNTAMQLPITLAGALMPDAHKGYGLPVGGVLATAPDKIIPYAIGVDIACRMCLSVFDLPTAWLEKEQHQLKNALLSNTFFGLGGRSGRKHDVTLFDRTEWLATPLLRSLKEKAYSQLGTSGTGNHFAEFGILEIREGAGLEIPSGKYLALLTHSGSRGFGGTIAGHYTKIAMEKTRLPGEAKHLAWLDLNKQEGQEYWLSMNLAGDYASANHHEIHNKIAKALGVERLLLIENHHNFAWLETLPDGRAALVHRKGATPAGEGVLGIIPGSMTEPGFVVRGKGFASALHSAAHGAGRQMSRRQAFNTLPSNALKMAVEAAGVQLFGSDLDEAPMVYKDIHKVMAAQNELVEVLAKFTPKIVRMADGNEQAED